MGKDENFPIGQKLACVNEPQPAPIGMRGRKERNPGQSSMGCPYESGSAKSACSSLTGGERYLTFRAFITGVAAWTAVGPLQGETVLRAPSGSLSSSRNAALYASFCSLARSVMLRGKLSLSVGPSETVVLQATMSGQTISSPRSPDRCLLTRKEKTQCTRSREYTARTHCRLVQGHCLVSKAVKSA